MLKQFLVISLVLISVIYCADKCFECNGHPNVPHYARNPRGCAWFFTCNPGLPVFAGKCPEPFLFNHQKQICDYPENVNCTDAIPATECPARGFALIPHPDACSKFVVCFDGNEQDRDCEPGLHFSPFDGKCVEPFLAQCTIDAAFCEANIDQPTFPKVLSTRNCTKYYICSENRVITQQCANGLHFNPENGFCEDETVAGCDTTNVLPELDFPLSQINFNCNGEIDGSSHSIPDSCDFWYICSGGNALIQRCGTGSIFDVNELRCVARSVNNSSCATDS